MRKTIEALCPEVDREVIQDFFARMDEDYFTTFSPQEISKHIALSRKLDPEHRIRVRITGDAACGRASSPSLLSGSITSRNSLCFVVSCRRLDWTFARETFTRSPGGRFVRRGHCAAARSSMSSELLSERAETFDEAKQREFQQELQIQAATTRWRRGRSGA